MTYTIGTFVRNVREYGLEDAVKKDFTETFHDAKRFAVKGMAAAVALSSMAGCNNLEGVYRGNLRGMKAKYLVQTNEYKHNILYNCRLLLHIGEKKRLFIKDFDCNEEADSINIYLIEEKSNDSGGIYFDRQQLIQLSGDNLRDMGERAKYDSLLDEAYTTIYKQQVSGRIKAMEEAEEAAKRKQELERRQELDKLNSKLKGLVGELK